MGVAGLPHLLTPGRHLTFVGGKGGVGKTTTAAALAVAMADDGERVLVLSVDPAHSLGDALATPLGFEVADVPGVPRLSALEVDAETERRRFLATHRGTLLELLLRGTYLDRGDVGGFLDLAVPGMDELAALLRLMRLAEEPELRLVVDTAPTGHTLRLLELPTLVRGWLGALAAMEARHQAVAAALAGAVADDDVTRFLAELDDDLARLDSLLTDPAATRFLLVTTAEPVVLAETLRLQDRLTTLGIALGGVLVNRTVPGARADAGGGGMAFVPRLAGDPRGLQGLRDFAAAATSYPATPSAPPSASGTLRVGEPFTPPAGRVLYLVGGKGGVGKSTVAGALAVLLAARPGTRPLLLSTDPAGSLDEVLAMPVGAEPAPVPGANGLHAQQVDAAAAWDGFRAGYREEAGRLFEGLLGSGLSAEADQRVIKHLIDLAPPGIDELVALLEVVDFVEDRLYDPLIVDTAPTGHLLRLLEMPGVALEWAHTVLRLLLKYRAVVGLGTLAERVLALSRSLRALRELLADPHRTWFLVVALPEALGVPETERLLPRLRALGIEPGAVLANRLLTREGGAVAGGAEHAAALLAIDPALPAAGAPALAKGPVGAEELRDFAASWRAIRPV